MTDADLVPVAVLDQAAADRAAALLRPSCASTRWAGRLVAGRPYRSLAGLTAASDAAIAELGWPDIEEALAAHPRIGDRPPGGGQPGGGGQAGGGQAGGSGAPGGSGQESAWSRQEQAGVARVSPDVEAGLRSGNLAYEERFGHVFLICATGRSAADMLAALHGRLGHEPAAEREVVRDELRRIVALRLGKTFR